MENTLIGTLKKKSILNLINEINTLQPYSELRTFLNCLKQELDTYNASIDKTLPNHYKSNCYIHLFRRSQELWKEIKNFQLHNSMVSKTLLAKCAHLSLDLAMVSNLQQWNVFLFQLSVASTWWNMDTKQLSQAEDILNIAETVSANCRAAIHCDNKKMRLSIYWMRFMVSLCHLRICAERDQFNEALSWYRRAEDFNESIGKDDEMLVTVVYYYGIQAKKKKLYEQAERWLKYAFKTAKNCSKYMVHKILNLLAETYLEHDARTCWEKAMECLQIADAYEESNSFLKLWCCLSGNKDDRIIKAVATKYAIGITTVNSAIQSRIMKPELVQLLLQHKRETIIVDVIPMIENRLSNNDKGQILLYSCWQLLDMQNHTLCEELLDSFYCTNFQPGKSSAALLTALTTDRAFHLSYAKQIDNALRWYMYSMRFMKSNPHSPLQNFINRNLSILNVISGNTILAKETFKKVTAAMNISETVHPVDSSLNLILKTLNGTVEDENTNFTVGQLVEENEELFCICLNQLLNEQKYFYAAKLLHYLLLKKRIKNQMHLICMEIFLSLIIHKNVSTVASRPAIVNHIQSTMDKLSPSPHGEWKNHDPCWFGKATWNVLINDSSFSPDEQFAMLSLAVRFLINCENDKHKLMNVSYLDTFLIMMASVGLNITQTTSQSKLKTQKIYREILQRIEERTSRQQETMAHMRNSSSSHLLLCYTFEIKMQLKDSSIKTFIEDVVKNYSMNVWHNMIFMTKKFGNDGKKIKREIFKAYFKTRPSDEKEFANQFQRLTWELKEEFDVCVDVSEATEIVNGIVEYISNVPNEYLSVITSQMQYLICRIWNIGVKSFLKKETEKGQFWCQSASKIVNVFPSMKSIYHQKMLSDLLEMFNL